jgi:hypothetical protein
MSSNQFGLWVLDLKVKAYEANALISRGKLIEADKKLTTCNAQLQHLHNYALQNSHINLQEYLTPLFEVEVLLKESEDKLRQLQEKPPIWKRVLGGVLRGVSFLTQIFGISNALTNLIANQAYKLLKPPSSD